jgi:hypothetical protein
MEYGDCGIGDYHRNRAGPRDMTLGQGVHSLCRFLADMRTLRVSARSGECPVFVHYTGPLAGFTALRGAPLRADVRR